MSRRASQPGFSLLEVVVVVAILAMMAGVVATGVGRSAESHLRRAAVAGLLDELMRARIQAMKTAQRVSLVASMKGEELSAMWSDRTRRWPLKGVRFQDVGQESAAMARAVFDPDGRTAQRTWAFQALDGGQSLIEIHFDPISGTPQLIDAAQLRRTQNRGR